MRTTFPLKNEESETSDTNLTQKNLESGDTDMAKWPKRVKHRNKVLAKIYRPCSGRDSYRLTWYAANKRQMKSFPTYAGPGGAKEFAEALVKELAKNSQAVMLTPAQASDALAAIERLGTFYQTTGRKVSLLAAVSDYCESGAKLHGRSMTEVIEGFNRNVATVMLEDHLRAVSRRQRHLRHVLNVRHAVTDKRVPQRIMLPHERCALLPTFSSGFAGLWNGTA